MAQSKRGDGVEVQFTGVGVVDDALRQLKNIERTKAVRAGLRAGGAYLVKQGRKRLKAGLHTDSAHKKRTGGRQPGNLLKSFRGKVKRSGTGVLAGFKRPEGAHSHFVDLGTEPRKTHDGRNRGAMPSLRYWSETRENDTDTAMQYIISGIEKAANRIMGR